MPSGAVTPCCRRQCLQHFINGALLVLIVFLQSGALNYFIINHFDRSAMSYFWFAGDMVSLVLFALALTLAHRRLGNDSIDDGSDRVDSNRDEMVVFQRFQIHWSHVPLCYLSWLFYSCLLLGKVVTIFKSNIQDYLKPDDLFGPQLLKVSIGVSAIVFALLVEGHHDTKPGSPRNAYITSVCVSASFDILDTVSFLGLLIVPESHLLLSFNLEDCILAFACANIVLPTVTLYKLSLSDYGIIYHVPLSVLYKILHLLVVNVPYLSIRLYLWAAISADISIFLLKNLYSIFVLIRSITPDLIKLTQRKRGSRIAVEMQEINGRAKMND